MTVAHAFGKRYDLPIPLAVFVFGGAAIVLLSFLLIVPRRVTASRTAAPSDVANLHFIQPLLTAISFLLLAFLIVCGIWGSQEVAENIVPTAFWLLIWIAVPLSCGIIGDYTERLNPFANIAKLADSDKWRHTLLARQQPLAWPEWLGWWPAVVLYVALACGELIFNQTAVLPAFTAWGLLVYAAFNAFMGLLFGANWLRYGEVFSVLYATWGRLGFWRFGVAGKTGFAGGLEVPFAATVSRITFVLLLLISVNFDGLLATPTWSKLSRQFPGGVMPGSPRFHLWTLLSFLLLALIIWAVFGAFAKTSSRAGDLDLGYMASLAGLLPSLVPIAFGYLLAHNIQYLLVNGQLLFPLIGNPVGKGSWPLHLPHPFNDSFEPHLHLLPSAFYWYFSVAVIIVVHILAVVLAHQHLGKLSSINNRSRRSEYPWIIAMVGYTMFSLWLLAQPLVQEKAVSRVLPQVETYAMARTILRSNKL